MSLFDDWKDDAEDLFDDADLNDGDLNIDDAEVIDEKNLAGEFEEIADEAPVTAETEAEEAAADSLFADEAAAETAAAPAARPRFGLGKKIAVGVGIAAVAAVAVVAGVFASGRNKFANGTTINDISVSRMTAEEAEAALNASYADYGLSVRIADEYTYTATAEDLSMGLRDDLDLQGMIDAQGFGSERALTVENLYTADLTDFHRDVAAYVSSVNLNEAQNAHLVFDEEKDEFVIEDAVPGYTMDAEEITENVENHVLALDPEVTYTMDDFFVTEPELGTDSEEVQEALEHANAYKDLEITVSFTPDGRETTYETIGWEQIRDWVSVDHDGLSIFIDDTALSGYVSEIADAHSVSFGTSQFRTTGGGYINVRAASAGQSVNSSGLYQRVYENLSNQTGGTVVAPFDAATQAEPIVDFGGNYVELDLNSQVMYCYNGGQLVCSAPCVSGNVSMGWATPNGVYHIYSKQTNRYLTGPGYRSFVNYWMPFNGGIGLHDGTWRSAFGGAEYLYNGSHGCVNLPLSAAATVFANVHEGTAVIVYGGATYAALAESGLTAPQTSFSLHCGQSAGIGATAATGIHYVSSNEAVATVAEDGTITAVTPGSVTITVTADQDQTHLGGTMDISVTVTHDWGSWTHAGGTNHRHTCAGCGATETAACDHTSGGTCSGCGHTYASPTPTPTPTPQTEPATEPQTQHSHTWVWVTDTEPTCDTAGVKHEECSSCHETRNAGTEIPATGHSYQWQWDGVTGHTHTCTVCGATDNSGACDHVAEGGACTVCGHEYPAPQPDPQPEPPEGGGE